MFTKQEIQQLKDQLEQFFDHYIENVALKAKVSRPTVSKFFKFQKVRTTNATKIYDTALELVQEQKNKQESRVKRVKILMGDEAENTNTAQGTLNLQ